MIPKSYITEWTGIVPWQEPRQIEQDLIITTALLKLYGNQALQESLAFRGGTALNKLFFNPPSRYSEDIDLVQTTGQAIGPTIEIIRDVMQALLGEPKRSFSQGCVTLSYRVTSEEGFPIKLKLEINTREHFSVLGFQESLFKSRSSWHSGDVIIRTYKIEELLGTKLRALYQRRKGRDLYDLYMALTTLPTMDVDAILQCFTAYTEHNQQHISQTLFLKNMEEKIKHKEFQEDTIPLLPRHKKIFNPYEAYEYVREQLIKKL